METKPPEKKGLLTKLKENVDDHEEQMMILGAMVRLGVVIWSGFIITLNYVELPMVKKSNASADITFVASIFTGALATFGLSTGNGKKNDKKEPTKPK
jgi:hypothetical protein|tara:strand:+ start:133 stop:426 length:294 start_codon:yes stop_codon:yes gene_type:complete